MKLMCHSSPKSLISATRAQKYKDSVNIYSTFLNLLELCMFPKFLNFHFDSEKCL